LFTEKVFPALKALKSFDEDAMQSAIKAFLDLMIHNSYKDEFFMDDKHLVLILTNLDKEAVSDLVKNDISKV
jgi:hypothetical protein